MSDSRLKSYALAASSAAAMATAGAANAGIVSSSGGPISINTNAPQTTLFTVAGIALEAVNTMTGDWSQSGYAFVSLGGGSISMTAVDNGDTIGSGFTGYQGAISAKLRFTGTVVSSCPCGMPLGDNQLMGISFRSGSDRYYAWVDYSLSMLQGEYTFTINSWAYNEVANESIIAGQDPAAGSTAVPGLGGLAALAIGAAGVRSRRQRTVA